MILSFSMDYDYYSKKKNKKFIKNLIISMRIK